jgi:hypothetical protein
VEEKEGALGLFAGGGDVEVLVRPAAGNLGGLKVRLERGERHGVLGRSCEEVEMASKGGDELCRKLAAGLSGQQASARPAGLAWSGAIECPAGDAAILGRRAAHTRTDARGRHK